jgi:uncharacterized protein YjbJ (UPF0337 family)
MRDWKSGVLTLSFAPAQIRTAFSMIQGDHTMNKDVFEGKWKQIEGQAKDWWGKLTDDDLKRVGGKYEKFVGLLQEKYGYTREHAEEEINRRVKDLKEAVKK